MQYFLQSPVVFIMVVILGVVSIFSYPAYSSLFYRLGFGLVLLSLFTFVMIRNRLTEKHKIKTVAESSQKTTSEGIKEVPVPENNQQSSISVTSSMQNHEILQSILTDIHSSYDSSKLRSLIIKNAVLLTGAHGGKLGITESGELNSGFDAHYIYSPFQIDLPSDCQPIMNTVAASKKAVKTSFSDSKHGENCYLLAVPLIRDNLTNGVILVVNKSTQFCERDLVNLNLFASQAALAINNTRLFEEAIRQAQTDSLTGLYNHRHFFELAKKEINRAQRYKHTLTVVMVDIDLFKYVNDTFGHPAGDQVIITIANLCRKHFRNIDIVGRYGGEEFSILLPETPVETAAEVAERLRNTVEKTVISYHRRHISVTVSLGLASLRNDCTSLTRLIERADTALYHAKAQGRNRVVIWKASMCYVGAIKHPRTFLRF